MIQFSNVSKVKIPSQAKDKQGLIQRKSAGRPQKPNMEYVQIRLDKVLHVQLKQYAQEHYTNKSSIVAQAIKYFIHHK